MNILEQITEAARRPGLMGLAGRALEKRCQRDLEGYFRKLTAEVEKLHLESVADQPKLLALHAVEVKLKNVLRKASSELKVILETNIHEALLKGDKLTQVREANSIFPDAGIDVLGMSGQEAADYASEQSGKLVTGINDTTLQLLQDAVGQGIEEQLGVPGTARLVKGALGDMTTKRAQMIASTEMNDAMSEATIRKLGRLGIGYVTWVLSDDACPECEENADEIVPIGELFPSGDARPPVHPNCRCAIVGSRAPEVA